MRIDVLAVQGAFAGHREILTRPGVHPLELRLPRRLLDLEGLTLPGGESTASGRIARRWGLVEPLRTFAVSFTFAAMGCGWLKR